MPLLRKRLCLRQISAPVATTARILNDNGNDAEVRARLAWVLSLFHCDADQSHRCDAIVAQCDRRRRTLQADMVQ